MTADPKAYRQRAMALRQRARAIDEPILRSECQQAALEWEWLAYEVERAGQAEAMSSST